MVQTWRTFTRRDLRPLSEAIRRVASSGDGGAYAHGVEVVVESPPLRIWEHVFGRRQGRRDRDNARIAVTDGDGRCGYPVHIRLYTADGPNATKRISRRPGWATSNTVGQAILMMKARAATAVDFDVTEVATGTVDALADLHRRQPTRGWRFRIDREVMRE